MSWCVESDKLGFMICVQDTPVTRRRIMSNISSNYFVFGIASQFMLKGRKILQEINSGKHSWNDPLSDEHVVKLTEWKLQLPLLNSISVNRCYKSKD